MSRTKQSWMKGRKERLTRAQRAALPAICEKWRNIALSTAPSDRKRAEEAIRPIYTVRNLTLKNCIWIESPDQFVAELEEGLRGFRWDYHGIGYNVHKGALRYYKASVVDHVWGVVSNSVPALPGALRLRESDKGVALYGQHLARGFAVADFFRTERHRVWVPFIDTLQYCGSFALRARSVVFIERPSMIKFDERGRLHCLDGPAIEYRNGSGIYAIHGLRVDRKWIDTPAEELSINDVLQEGNSAVRAALIARIGFPRLLRTAKYKTISRRKGNALVEFAFSAKKYPKFPDHLPALRLRALHLTWHDKTGPKETVVPVPRTMRQFGEDCPRNIDSVEQVRRWTLGWPKEATSITET